MHLTTPPPPQLEVSMKAEEAVSIQEGLALWKLSQTEEAAGNLLPPTGTSGKEGHLKGASGLLCLSLGCLLQN